MMRGKFENPDLLLFNTSVGGHHAEHIGHIVSYWTRERPTQSLVVAAHPSLLDVLNTEFARSIEGANSNVQFIGIEKARELDRGLELGLRKIGSINTKLLRTLIDRYQPKHVHAMYLDYLQLGLATSLRFSYDVRISGQLFRNDFHYGSIGAQDVDPLNQRVRRLRKKMLLWACMKNPHLSHLFTLDPFAPAAINRLAKKELAVYQPEPIDPEQTIEPPESIRDDLGVEPHRTMLLHFGALNGKRKGTAQLLQSLRYLPPDVASSVAIVLVGQMDDEIRTSVQHFTAALEDSLCQIIVRDEFYPYHRVQSLVSAADACVLPYQHHIGSSGVLVRSARVGTPVICQNTGVLGELVSRHSLGQAVNTTNVQTLANSIVQFVADPRTGFDAEIALDFSMRHSVEAFVETLFTHIVPKTTT